MLALSCLLMQQWNKWYEIMRFPERKAVNEIPATAKSRGHTADECLSCTSVIIYHIISLTQPTTPWLRISLKDGLSTDCNGLWILHPLGRWHCQPTGIYLGLLSSQYQIHCLLRCFFLFFFLLMSCKWSRIFFVCKLTARTNCFQMCLVHLYEV